MSLESIIVACVNFSVMLLFLVTAPSISKTFVPYRSQEEEWQQQELGGEALTCFKNSSKFSFWV